MCKIIEMLVFDFTTPVFMVPHKPLRCLLGTDSEKGGRNSTRERPLSNNLGWKGPPEVIWHNPPPTLRESVKTKGERWHVSFNKLERHREKGRWQRWLERQRRIFSKLYQVSNQLTERRDVVLTTSTWRTDLYSKSAVGGSSNEQIRCGKFA